MRSGSKVFACRRPAGTYWARSSFLEEVRVLAKIHTRTAGAIPHLSSSSLPQKDRSKPLALRTVLSRNAIKALLKKTGPSALEVDDTWGINVPTPKPSSSQLQ